MPNPIYAQIDAENICRSITEYYSEITPTASMIPLDTFDITVVGMMWDADAPGGGAWVDNPNPPDPPEEP